jgi:hypothetical protein
MPAGPPSNGRRPPYFELNLLGFLRCRLRTRWGRRSLLMRSDRRPPGESSVLVPASRLGLEEKSLAPGFGPAAAGQEALELRKLDVVNGRSAHYPFHLLDVIRAGFDGPAHSRIQESCQESQRIFGRRNPFAGKRIPKIALRHADRERLHHSPGRQESVLPAEASRFV